MIETITYTTFTAIMVNVVLVAYGYDRLSQRVAAIEQRLQFLTDYIFAGGKKE